MDDEGFKRRPLARWYMGAASLSFVLMLIMVIDVVIHLTTDPNTLALDKRAQFEAEPFWMVAAFGLAAMTGAVGGLMLILKRRIAEPLMLVALVAAAAWLIGLLVDPGLRDLISPNQIAGGLVVLAMVWTIFWFARHSRQRGWLS